MEVYILTWIVDIFYIFTLHILAKRVLGVRVKNKLLLIAGWCIYMIGWNLLSYLFAEMPLVTGIGNLCMMLLVIGNLYDSKLQNKIIVIFVIIIFGMTAEMIIVLVYSFMGTDIFGGGSEKNNLVYSASVISKVICFMFVKIVITISNTKKQVEIRFAEWIEIFVVPVGSLIVFHIISWDDYFAITMPKVVVFSVLLLINLLSYYAYQRMQLQAEEVMENLLLKQQGEYYKDRYEDAEKQWAALRKMRHDMKNNYILHMHYLENGQYDKLKESYEKLLEDATWEKRMVHTGNIGIDSIVNFKAEMAKEQKVLVNCVAEVRSDIRADNGDMNILLGNLFDNAIEAVVRLSEEERCIELKILADETAMLIEIGNPYEGNLSRDIKDGITTIKRDKDNHGLGLKIIKGVVEKYHGMLEIHTDNQYFRTKVFMYYPEN